MAKIGVLSLDLVARTGKLTPGLKKAQAGITSLRMSAKVATAELAGLAATSGGFMAARLAAMLGPLTAVVGGFFSLAAATRRVMNEFADIDNLAKTADKLGLATEELVGFRHAAAQTAGMVDRQLDTALQRFIRRVAEAASGTGEAKQAIRELGLDAGALNTAGPAAALGMVADAFTGIASQSDRVRLGFKLFDAEGVSLINTLRVGSEGLNQYRADAERLGIAISRTDASKVEAANDAMDRLGKAVKGVASVLAIELAPFVESGITAIVQWGTEGAGAASRVSAGVGIVIDKLAAMLNVVDAARTAWARLQLGGQEFASANATAIALVVHVVERGLESIVGGFRNAFARAQLIVQEAVSAMISILADVASWIESKLPERFRLGIGKAAAEFSAGFAESVEMARANLDQQDFDVDLNIGAAATRQVAQGMQDNLAIARREFDAFENRELLSTKLRKGIESIRKDAEAAANAATTTPMIEPPESAVASATTAAALTRGSQEAFSSFLKASRGEDVEKDNLAENKAQTKILRNIDRKMRGLQPAVL